MKMAAARCILVAFVLACATPSIKANPVAKVLELLGGFHSKITKEGEDASKVYAELTDTCDDKSKDLGFAIQTGERDVEALQAAIAKEDSKIGEFGAKIDGLVASIAEAAADLKAAQENRAKESADFTAEEKELLEVIDTLQRAIGILQKELQGASSSAAMLQVQNAKGLAQALQAMVEASVVSSADANRLSALAQTSAETDQREEAEADDAALGAPDAAVYENHSGGIIETLNGLLDKAQEQLGAARKAELTASHNFDLLKQSLDDETNYANKDMAASKEARTASAEAKAAATGDLDATSNALATDKNDLASLQEYCKSAADDFAAEQKARSEELNALQSAIDAISGATGAAAKTYAMNQMSLLQRSSRIANKGFETARFLRQLANGKGATAELAQLASRISSTVRLAARTGSDPFGKVKGLIADMIKKLQEEQTADATKKAYCDKEMAAATASRNEKAAAVEKLSTSIDKKAARSALLKEEVATIQKELADLASSQAEADKVRSEEKALFAENKPELEAGIQAVQTGVKILKEQYGAGSDAINSVLGFLEVVESDFSKSLAETVAAEETAQSEYERLSKENEITKTAKDKDVEYKNKEMATLTKDIGSATSDREGVQTELDSVLEYLAELKKTCIAKPETYKDRAARRAAEIAGLKEALEILGNEAGFVQQGSLRGVKRHI